MLLIECLIALHVASYNPRCDCQNAPNDANIPSYQPLDRLSKQLLIGRNTLRLFRLVSSFHVRSSDQFRCRSPCDV